MLQGDAAKSLFSLCVQIISTQCAGSCRWCNWVTWRFFRRFMARKPAAGHAPALAAGGAIGLWQCPAHGGMCWRVCANVWTASEGLWSKVGGVGQVVRTDDAGEPQAGLHRDAQHQGEVSIHSRAGGAQTIMAMPGGKQSTNHGPGRFVCARRRAFGKIPVRAAHRLRMPGAAGTKKLRLFSEIPT